MVKEIKQYAKYKNCDEIWLNKIPDHWVLVRTKNLFNERSVKGYINKPLLAATQKKGVIPKDQFESRTVLALKDLHQQKLVCVNDFVISLRSFQGGIEYARQEGIISPAYTILDLKEKKYHEYLTYLFKSNPYIENLNLYVTGIRQGQNIDYEKLSRSFLPIPPLEEQNAIVRFLDYYDRRIKHTIRAKQKLIKLLNEYKQAIIHQAVTRGLDPKVKLKPSGVEWLGEIPKKWNIKKLKNCVSNIVEITKNKLSNEIYIALENVESWSGELINLKEEVSFYGQVKKFKPEDVLFGKLRPYLAKIYSPRIDGVCVSEFFVLRPNKEFVTKSFFELIIKTKNFIEKVNSSTYGAKMPRTSWLLFGNILLPLPPLEEQEIIVRTVNFYNKKIDAYIKKLLKELLLLHEYNICLLSTIVTGKIDIREADAHLEDHLILTDVEDSPDDEMVDFDDGWEESMENQNAQDDT